MQSIIVDMMISVLDLPVAGCEGAFWWDASVLVIEEAEDLVVVVVVVVMVGEVSSRWVVVAENSLYSKELGAPFVPDHSPFVSMLDVQDGSTCTSFSVGRLLGRSAVRRPRVVFPPRRCPSVRVPFGFALQHRALCKLTSLRLASVRESPEHRVYLYYGRCPKITSDSVVSWSLSLSCWTKSHPAKGATSVKSSATRPNRDARIAFDTASRARRLKLDFPRSASVKRLLTALKAASMTLLVVHRTMPPSWTS